MKTEVTKISGCEQFCSPWFFLLGCVCFSQPQNILLGLSALSVVFRMIHWHSSVGRFAGLFVDRFPCLLNLSFKCFSVLCFL